MLLACGPGSGEDATLFQLVPPENILLSVTQNESEGKVREVIFVRGVGWVHRHHSAAMRERDAIGGCGF